MPVNDAAGTRVGTIAAEQAIRPPSSSGAAVSRADLFQFPGELVPVSLELAFEDIRLTPDPDRIDITGPNGRHLVTAVVTPSDLTQARAHWRQVTTSVAEMTAAVFVLLLCGPLLDWRDFRRFEISSGSRVPVPSSPDIPPTAAPPPCLLTRPIPFQPALPAG